jgi:AcrR family transcriptional regulator
VKHSLIRQHIIETASSLFYRNGYNSTGINEIISVSGIAKATLYNHFRSKENICIEYLKYKNGIFLSEIEEYSVSQPKGKLQLIALFDYLQKCFIQEDFNGCWCIKTVSEIPKDNKNVRNEIQTQKKLFIQLISDLVTQNKIAKNEKEIISLSRRIYLLYESAVSESHLHLEDWPIKESKLLCSQMI